MSWYDYVVMLGICAVLVFYRFMNMYHYLDYCSFALVAVCFDYQ